MAKVKVSGPYILAACTGYVQPLGVAMNQPLKRYIKEAAESHRDQYKEEYKS